MTINQFQGRIPLEDTTSFAHLTDHELLDRCELYGRNALLWRNKFRALLPEVARRRLYIQRGCSSIYVFGQMLAGLSQEQIDESLNIKPRLDDKPHLRALLESGEVSVNKMRRVMPIATQDNEEELAVKVRVMSLGTLKTFVRDYKQEIKQDVPEAESWVNPKTERNSLFMQEHGNEFGFSQEVIEKLHELREKGININQALMEFLNQRAREIAEKKEVLAQSLPEESSRHIPARIKAILKEEYGTKCAKPTCRRPAQQLHHTARYSLTHSHDPHYMAPLCREHHEIAHAIDVNVQECKWKK